jgi:hypothetical protein
MIQSRKSLKDSILVVSARMIRRICDRRCSEVATASARPDRVHGKRGTVGFSGCTNRACAASIEGRTSPAWIVERFFISPSSMWIASQTPHEMKLVNSAM